MSPDPIEYTIDISTREGQLNLYKVSPAEAEELALTEAAIKHKCAVIFNPQCSYLLSKDKKRVLRVTVYGFPANFKNQDK